MKNEFNETESVKDKCMQNRRGSESVSIFDLLFMVYDLRRKNCQNLIPYGVVVFLSLSRPLPWRHLAVFR